MSAPAAPDSTPTPTPVSPLGYREVGMRCKSVGKELGYLSEKARRRKPLTPGDLAESKRLAAMAYEAMTLATRARGWGDRDGNGDLIISGAALAGEKNHVVVRLVELTREMDRADNNG